MSLSKTFLATTTDISRMPYLQKNNMLRKNGPGTKYVDKHGGIHAFGDIIIECKSIYSRHVFAVYNFYTLRTESATGEVARNLSKTVDKKPTAK